MKQRKYVEGQSKRLNKAVKNSVATLGIASLMATSIVCLAGNTDSINASANASAMQTAEKINYIYNLPPKPYEVHIQNGIATAGVATALKESMEKYRLEYREQLVKETPSENSENKQITENKNIIKIRCTGYTDYGVTKSGEITHKGVVAGKKEWLGKKCTLYTVNSKGKPGEVIGTYEFLDTGYGINGSLINGTSIDVWHHTEEAVWDWMRTYGDYVYMEMIDSAT